MKKVTSAVTQMAVKDEWLTAAMTDDQVVAELLLRLKHAVTVVPDNLAVNLPPLLWGIRRRRSRRLRSSRFGGSSAHVSLKKDVDSARASPKNHLSWSGGSGSGGSTSPSAATTDEFEHTSRQTSCSTSTAYGSKVPFTLLSPSLSKLKRDLTRESRFSLLSISLHLDCEFSSRGLMQIRRIAGFSVPI